MKSNDLAHVEKTELKKILKKKIDHFSCSEPLEVGFRRGAEWALFESDFAKLNYFDKIIENKDVIFEKKLLIEKCFTEIYLALHKDCYKTPTVDKCMASLCETFDLWLKARRDLITPQFLKDSYNEPTLIPNNLVE